MAAKPAPDMLKRAAMERPRAVPQARWLVAALVAVAAGGLVAHSLVWNFVTDDAFISFVYSRNLADHGQLVFNLGERVEGYTNFSWTVLLALLYKAGLAPELMSRVLGTAAGAATFWVTARMSRRLGDGAWSVWDALPAFLLAAVPGYACWSSGGLETQLFTLLSTLGFAAYLDELSDGKARLGGGVAFGLAALTRPEGLLFFALTCGHRGLERLLKPVKSRLWPRRDELVAIGVFLALVVPHLIWRRWYYGWWLPNTFYIKASGGAGTWSQGGYYLSRWALQFHLWAIPVLMLGGFWRGVPRRAVGYFVLVATVFCVYVASVGGDFMGLFRFMMPILPIAVVMATVSLRRILDGLPAFSQLGIVVCLLSSHIAHAVSVDKASLVIGADRGIDSPGFLRWYTADRAAIGKWFGRIAKPDDFAAVGGAGAQVWYSGIPSLDCFGLSDSYIAHKVVAGSSRPGHQKYAPLEYQLQRRPTIITSAYYRIQNTPYIPSPAEQADWERRGYHYVNVEVPGLSQPWYAFLLRNDRTVDAVREP